MFFVSQVIIISHEIFIIHFKPVRSILLLPVIMIDLSILVP